MALGDASIARGARSDSIYLERFNLTPQDVLALPIPRPKKDTSDLGKLMRYFRLPMLPGYFYSFDGLRTSSFVYVVDVKVLGGRDQEWDEQEEASGRKLPVAFFELAPGSEPDDAQHVIIRTNRETGSLATVTVSLAELIRCMGYYPTVPPDATSKLEEELLMQGWLAHEPLRWGHERIASDEDAWMFALTSPVNAEREGICRRRAPWA